MTPLQRYIAEEIAVDHADGLLTRREALRRLGLLGIGAAAAAAVLAACATENVGSPATSAATSGPASATQQPPGPAVATEAVTFAGPSGRTIRGAWARAATPRGGVVVIHENRGLTDHIKSVAGRLAASGYSALAVDLLSEEGGTESFTDSAQATAALGRAPQERLIADTKAGIGELARRLPGLKLGAMGFCFGGGMVWSLLDAGEPRLAAAVPFYGPAPDNADFTGSKAAVLGIYAEQDSRVNASRAAADDALTRAGLAHEMVTYPGVNHAFFNDTGARYDATAAAAAYQRVLDWFAQHLG